MSTLAEIEAAVVQLPPPQQQELYAFLAAQLNAGPKQNVPAQTFEHWIQTARGAGRPGITTEAIMALTRGEE
jgi:hypothetical protein